MAAFVALVIATVAAFFVTQHLKVSTPLIQYRPAPVPNTINPVYGASCPRRNGRGVVRLDQLQADERLLLPPEPL